MNLTARLDPLRDRATASKLGIVGMGNNRNGSLGNFKLLLDIRLSGHNVSLTAKNRIPALLVAVFAKGHHRGFSEPNLR
jgi:hypothetical protein